ncbi:hypothetical protein B0H13DRAFT_1646553 [Mycena leptocephala]|nr:hypothetical protein B0H13DRAFT_1646553 [Mycena leptocephala]
MRTSRYGPVAPKDAPDWLANAIDFLTTIPLGPHFEALLEAWVRAEVAHGFDDNPTQGIPKTGRPEVLDEWIRAGRWVKSGKATAKKLSKKKQLSFDVRDLEGYGKIWSTWWDSLQPAWRTKEADGRYSIGTEYGEDWGVLAIPGQNGSLTVVAGLYFWGSARRTPASVPDGMQEEWEAAVLDVAWMLEGLEMWLSD